MTINDITDQPASASQTTASAPALDKDTSPSGPLGITKMQKRVLAGGSIGQFIEFYDFTLYGLTAVIFSQLFFPGSDPVTAMLATFATFGVAFVVRPVGGLFFGALGDRIGRRRVLTITLVAIGGATALMGLLPTYGQIGAWAPVLLVLCRLIQGFSAGGESVGAPSFVFGCPGQPPRVLAQHHHRRHCAALRRRRFDDPHPEPVNAQRRLHGVGLAPAVPAGPAARPVRRLDPQPDGESDAFNQAKAARTKEFSPVREAFRENRLRMVQVIFVMGLTAMGFYFLSAYSVSYVQTTGHLSREQSLLVNAAGLALYAVLLPLGGRLGYASAASQCSSPVQPRWPCF